MGYPDFRKSNIPNAYHFKEDIRRRATPTESPKSVESDVPALKFREDSHVYFRTIGRLLRNKQGGHSRWGDADTYDHARKPPAECKYDERGKGNGSRGGGHFRDIIGLIIEV